jgi:hypothetical protein
MRLSRSAAWRRLVSSLGLLGALGLASSCGTEPDDLLVGQWGNAGTLLGATAEGATIAWLCGGVQLPEPIRLRDDGTFSAAGTYAGGVNAPHFAVHVAGYARGDQVALGIAGDTTFVPRGLQTLHAGVVPDFGGSLCAD